MPRRGPTARESRRLHREHDGQLLQRDIVDHLIVGALQSGGRDRHERSEPRDRQTRREGDRVLQGAAAHLEATVREAPRELAETGRAPVGRYDDEARIRGRLLAQPLPQHLAVARAAVLTRGGRLARAGEDLQELRTAPAFQVAQRRHQGADVVAVQRADVVEAQLLEHRPRQHHSLQVPLGAARQLPHGRGLAQYLLPAIAQLGVQRPREHLGKPIGQGAASGGACRITVVENHQHVGVQRAGMIEGLKRHARGQGAIPDDRHDLSRLTPPCRRNRHGERGADRSAAMCRARVLVPVCEARRERRRAARVSVKAIAPAAQHRVGETLVATVPDDAVGGGVEHVMHGDRQFNRREPRGQPLGRYRDVASQQGAHFGSERRELRNLQALQVRGQLERVQQEIPVGGAAHALKSTPGPATLALTCIVAQDSAYVSRYRDAPAQR